MQPEQGELQHQEHGTAFKSVSIWILQMGPTQQKRLSGEDERAAFLQ